MLAQEIGLSLCGSLPGPHASFFDVLDPKISLLLRHAAASCGNGFFSFSAPSFIIIECHQLLDRDAAESPITPVFVSDLSSAFRTVL